MLAALYANFLPIFWLACLIAFTWVTIRKRIYHEWWTEGDQTIVFVVGLPLVWAGNPVFGIGVGVIVVGLGVVAFWPARPRK